MALTLAARRKKWTWLPNLPLMPAGRSAAASDSAVEPALDANAQTLLRMVAHLLPECVPVEAKLKSDLEDISDQLESLALGMPETSWAESLAEELAMIQQRDAAQPPVRVSWG